MKNHTSDEFSTVDILLQSDADSRAVDAFVISWVKLEKQLRRLTSNLIFQHSNIEKGVSGHEGVIRNAILQKRTANHDRFIGAIYLLSGHSVKYLVGDQYPTLKREIGTAYKYRNKIFHGQQTGQSLTRSDLEKCIASMKDWCELLAKGASEHIGYNGFSKNSLQKNGKAQITEKVDNALADGLEKFIHGI
jgi:hypothetical protein